jgi:hypothetical protein
MSANSAFFAPRCCGWVDRAIWILTVSWKLVSGSPVQSFFVCREMVSGEIGVDGANVILMRRGFVNADGGDLSHRPNRHHASGNGDDGGHYAHHGANGGDDDVSFAYGTFRQTWVRRGQQLSAVSDA